VMSNELILKRDATAGARTPNGNAAPEGGVTLGQGLPNQMQNQMQACCGGM